MAHDDQRRREIVEALRGVALFRGLTAAERAGLATRVVRKRYARDEVIFGQGEPGCGLYIVVRGHVGIRRQGPGGAELLLTLAGPGEYFGELALFDGAPRSAGAMALDACGLLVLPRDAFRAFLEAHPAALWTWRVPDSREVALPGGAEVATGDGRRSVAGALAPCARDDAVAGGTTVDTRAEPGGHRCCH
jgi:hypothetical protein